MERQSAKMGTPGKSGTTKKSTPKVSQKSTPGGLVVSGKAGKEPPKQGGKAGKTAPKQKLTGKAGKTSMANYNESVISMNKFEPCYLNLFDVKISSNSEFIREENWNLFIEEITSCFLNNSSDGGYVANLTLNENLDNDNNMLVLPILKYFKQYNDYELNMTVSVHNRKSDVYMVYNLCDGHIEHYDNSMSLNYASKECLKNNVYIKFNNWKVTTLFNNMPFEISGIAEDIPVKKSFFKRLFGG